MSSLDAQRWVKDVFATPRATRYPIKLLRYWFMYELIKEESARLGRSLRICEIGVDRGQMRRFVHDAGFDGIECWDAVDCRLQPELNAAGYSRQIEANVDLDVFALDEKYDVIIVLHLLEHLFEPEKLMLKLAAALVPDGIVVGGFPVTPEWLASFQQRKIRRTASKFGHVSVFSPKRVGRMAENCGLKLDFLSGCFFVRKSGAAIENAKNWIRLNLLWGALFPALGGEIYWRMRNH